MAMHPEFVNTGSSRGYWFFVIVQLIVAAFLLASFIPNRHNLKRITVSLILAGIVVILLGLIFIQGIDWYLGRYGFYDVAILLSIFIVTNLIAGILLIIASVKIKRSTSSEKK
jgi:biotin transporter BioY